MKKIKKRSRLYKIFRVNFSTLQILLHILLMYEKNMYICIHTIFTIQVSLFTLAAHESAAQPINPIKHSTTDDKIN